VPLCIGRYFNRLLLSVVFSLLFFNSANSYCWVESVPAQVILVDGGLLVNGSFDTSGYSL
jgi:hypothetical protein